MNELIVEMDTRNQVDNFVTEYLDKNNVKWIRNKLYTGDVKTTESCRVIIDLKKDLVELCNNLCKDHVRIRKEIDRAREINCNRFIFLIKEEYIKTVDDVINWIVPTKRNGDKYTEKSPEALQKTMITMSERYGIEFLFTTEEDAGRKVLELLQFKN